MATVSGSAEKFWSKTPWQFMQYVFKINHDISMQEIFCINCAATR
jgi:hypothetical protein